MGRAIRLSTLALLLATGCAAPRPSPAQAYEQGRKAGAAAYVPPPTTAAEQHDPAEYYRSMKSDARSSPDRYYAGPVWHWESQNFRQGFIDGIVEALEARALKADAAARGSADDYALGKKMALELGAANPGVDFKSMPGRCLKEPGGMRLNLALNAETYYRTTYVDLKQAKPWDQQPERFRTGFVEGFRELCGADEADKDVARTRRSPAEEYLLGFQAGKRSGALVDPDERSTLNAAPEEQIRELVSKHYKEGAATSSAYDPAKESEKFQEGYSDGFREACGLK